MLEFHPGPSRNHHLSGKQQAESLSRLPGRVFREIEILDHTFRDGVSPLATRPPDRKSGLTIATMSTAVVATALALG